MSFSHGGEKKLEKCKCKGKRVGFLSVILNSLAEDHQPQVANKKTLAKKHMLMENHHPRQDKARYITLLNVQMLRASCGCEVGLVCKPSPWINWEPPS